MYGLKDPDTGRVGPFNKGAMFGSIEVFLFDGSPFLTPGLVSKAFRQSRS